MKKNLWFKLGLFCAALVLVATCFITGAWAKYTKTVTATDSARVAKFAFEVKADEVEMTTTTQTIDIFGTTLDHIKQVSATDKSNKVGADKIIAPGSHGDFKISLANNGEVALKFEAKCTEEKNADNIPLAFSINGTDYGYDSLNAALIAAINGKQIEVDADALDVTIYWQWVYEGGRDTADTDLGTDGTAKYEVKIAVTATQVKPE